MRHKKFRQHRGTDQTFHHILFQKKFYQQGYAKKLREHPYMGKYIDNTLHSTLHSKIHNVPTPNGRECRQAYALLSEYEKKQLINCLTDPLEQRIDFLIELWQDVCPATVAILKWQRDIITKFYAKSKSAS